MGEWEKREPSYVSEEYQERLARLSDAELLDELDIAPQDGSKLAARKELLRRLQQYKERE